MQTSLSSFFFVFFLSVATIVASADGVSFLRPSSLSTTTDGSSDDDDDYKHLMTCLLNGTDVATCHQLDCLWCHSSFFNLCVTNKTAWNIDGSYFACEGVVHNDDDVVIDDDDAASSDDTVTPGSDDSVPDDDHTSEWHYMDDLLKCMNHTKDGCGPGKLDEDGLVCVWCYASGMGGECLSEAAADNMEGPVFSCDRE